jgi:hypothetical protein
MGYGDNPFLIYHHSDTDNNHVHMVSTRVDKNGDKVDDTYEKIRSQKTLQTILQQDPQMEAKAAFDLLQTDQKEWIVMGYGINSFITLSIFYVWMTKMLSVVFNDTKWKIYSELICMVVILSFIGMNLAVYENLIGTMPILNI